MLRRAAALLLIGASIAVWVGCASTVNHFVYAALPSANEIRAYREDPNSGVLTELQTSPYIVGTASEPQALVLHPSQKYLYVANAEENDIAEYLITDGQIAEQTPRTLTGTTPTKLTIDNTGSYLYAANAGSNNISVFAIDSGSGKLSEISASPFPIGLSPTSLQIDPAGGSLYVGGSGGITGGVVEAFSLTSGVLSPLTGSPYSTGRTPTGIAIDPGGKFLFTTNFTDNSISSFTIGTGGVLSAIAGSPIGEPTNTSAPINLLVDPSSKYLYVANERTNNVSGYTISTATGSEGGLTALTNSPFTTASQPNSLATDPGGNYLFVGFQGGQLQVYGLDVGNGTLTLVKTYSTGGAPTSIVVVQ